MFTWEMRDVIGVTVGKLDAVAVARVTGDIPQNVNFAIKSTIARAFLDTHGVAYELGGNVSDLTVPEIAERARNFAVAIICVE